MKLTRFIPARTETFVAVWCHKSFTTMSQQFRAIRAGARNKLDKCFWCKEPFADGDVMALACFEKRGNEVLCQQCADRLLESGNDPHSD